MIHEMLEQLAILIENNIWLAPLLALAAGVLTSFTPCSLSSIPLIIGYVGGIGENNTKKALGYSVVFSIGNTITFLILGIIAATLGTLIGFSSWIWHFILGILMLLMALQTFGVYDFVPSVNLIVKNQKSGYIGAFLAGMLGGSFSSHCSTPILIAILTFVMGRESFLLGILLMLLYSVGHSTLVIIAGTSVGFVQKIKDNYNKVATLIKIVMGIIILLIGFYMFWLAFN